jgi:hypothetical protein
MEENMSRTISAFAALRSLMGNIISQAGGAWKTVERGADGVKRFCPLEWLDKRVQNAALFTNKRVSKKSGLYNSDQANVAV